MLSQGGCLKPGSWFEWGVQRGDAPLPGARGCPPVSGLITSFLARKGDGGDGRKGGGAPTSAPVGNDRRYASASARNSATWRGRFDVKWSICWRHEMPEMATGQPLRPSASMAGKSFSAPMALDIS